MTFEQLNMHPSILRAITQDGYHTPTDIQAEAIPHLLKGSDMLGSAQTGTGKTAAFALPIIHHVQQYHSDEKKRLPKALIMAPTRELALQIKESFDAYSRKNQVKTIAVYGGMPKRAQIVKIKRGVDILIATPGRLLDLLNMKVVKLDRINQFVLDEADQMMDMGFIDDVKTIITHLPKNRQTMLFSATLPPSIVSLSKAILTNPVRIEVTPQNTPLETINQSVYFLKSNDKIKLLKDKLKNDDVTSALVFVRTKQGCNRIANQLVAEDVNAGAIHGDKTQSQRQSTLRAFKKGNLKVLVATDVAARGIDIDALSHVINMDMPQTPETYLHRIGRTARAGKIGSALSFCAPEETHLLKAIQKHIGMVIPVENRHDFVQSPKQKNQGKSQSPARNQKGRHTKNTSRKKPVEHAQVRPETKENKPQRKNETPQSKPSRNARLSEGFSIEKSAATRKNTMKSSKPFGKKKHKHKKKQRTKRYAW